MKRISTSLLTALALLAAAPPLLAQTAAPATSTQAAAPASDDWTSGEVRRVDAANQRLSLRHGEIKNLNMPAMSMVFGVRDAALLQGLKAGDKVRFVVIDEGGGKLTITALERVN